MEQVRIFEDSTAILSYRESDLDFCSAVGEVLDNSIQANAGNIEIISKVEVFQKNKNYRILNSIGFADDGHGMDSEVLHRCLKMGYSTRYNDRNGIGRFGVGMTLGSINQCKRVEIYSKAENGEWLYTYIDIDEIVKGIQGFIPAPISKNLSEEYKKFQNLKSGTVVVWSKIDRQQISEDALMKELDVWIGRTYRKFFWGEVTVNGRNTAVNVFLNGQKILPIDPLYFRSDRFPNDAPAKLAEIIKFPWNLMNDEANLFQKEESEISIQLSLTDRSIRESRGIGNSNETKIRFLDMNEGISILRNGREVFYGHIPYFQLKFNEIDRWWGCEISFNAVLDKSFCVKNIKRGAVPVKDLKDAIYSRIKPTIDRYLEIIREDWKSHDEKKKEEELKKNSDSLTFTGHETAEKIAKVNNIKKITQSPEFKEKAGSLIKEKMPDIAITEQTAWITKFSSQPYTILDSNWKSAEFMEVNHLGGSDVIRYNTYHLFIQHLNKIIEQINSENVNKELAMQLKSLIDLLLISFAKSESSFDNDKEFKASEFFEELRINWGQFLKSYVKSWIDGKGQ